MTARLDICSACQGQGGTYIHGWVSCPKCAGTGQIMVFGPTGGGSGVGGSGGGSGGSSRGRGYELEAISKAMLEAVPRSAHWVLAALGVVAFLAIGINQGGETGFLVFMALCGGAMGGSVPNLLILVIDLTIKLLKLVVVLAIAGAGLAVGYYVMKYFLN